MQKAVITICHGSDHERIGAITHPVMRQYARRIGADFRVLTGKSPIQMDGLASDIPKDTGARLAKLELAELLKTYDRLIYFDNTVVINPRCPDLFTLVPKDKVGATYETRLGIKWINEFSDLMQEAFDYYGVPPCTDFFNSGVMVISRCHRSMFTLPEIPVKRFRGWLDQTLLNAMCRKHGFELHDLGLRFNYMGVHVKYFDSDRSFRKKISCSPEEAYVVHMTRSFGSNRERLNRIERLVHSWYGPVMAHCIEKTRAHFITGKLFIKDLKRYYSKRLNLS